MYAFQSWIQVFCGRLNIVLFVRTKLPSFLLFIRLYLPIKRVGFIFHVNFGHFMKLLYRTSTNCLKRSNLAIFNMPL